MSPIRTARALCLHGTTLFSRFESVLCCTIGLVYPSAGYECSPISSHTHHFSGETAVCNSRFICSWQVPKPCYLSRSICDRDKRINYGGRGSLLGCFGPFVALAKRSTMVNVSFAPTGSQYRRFRQSCKVSFVMGFQSRTYPENQPRNSWPEFHQVHDTISTCKCGWTGARGPTGRSNCRGRTRN